MSRVKGQYVATVIISMDANEGENGLLNYHELKKAWDGMSGEIKKVIEEDFGFNPQTDSIEVIEQKNEFYKVD